MKLFRILLFFIAGTLMVSTVSAQANAFINILSQNSGQVNVGATLMIQVDIGNTGPTSSIGANKVRAQISVPSALVTVLPNAQQTGLPPNWTITSNTGSAITICNGTDVIAVGTQRTALIAVQAVAVGGPSTIAGVLSFGPGTGVCTGPGSLNGDNTADNTSTTSVTVNPAPSCSLTGVTAAAGTIVCNGNTTTLTATPAGISTGIEYSITGTAGPFQTSNTFTVSAGTYVVTARQITTPACIATAPAVTVNNPPIVVPPVPGTITQPSCTVATGSVELTGLPSGNWTINPGAITGSSATTTINNLSPNTYTFTVTNASGCSSAASSAIVINAQPSTPAAPVTGTVTQPTCTISTGSVVLNGLPAGAWTINPGSVTGTGTTTTIENLGAGTYNFTVTNVEGCTSPASGTVIINNVIGAPSAPVVNIVQPTCTVATGTITVTSSTMDLTFSLDGGPYTAYPPGGYVVAAGTHTITEQNLSNCTSPVTNITVDPPPSIPAAPDLSVLQPTCAVAAGTITVTTPTTGLLFSLDGGPYAAYPSGGYVVTSGPHTISAQNSAGCVSGATPVTVNTQPVPPTASASAGTIACSGGTTTLTVTATGGTGALEYSKDGTIFQSSNTFIVGAGTYTVTVREMATPTCTATTNTVIIAQPAALAVNAVAGVIPCNGGTTTITVTAMGGSGVWEYRLDGGLFQASNIFTAGPGTHRVTARIASNPACTAESSDIIIAQPSTLTASATASRITQCGGTTVVTVSATGGTLPYTGTGSFAKGPGTYNYSITDAGGCTSSAQIIIEAPGCMQPRVFPNPAGNSITIDHSEAAPGSMIQVFSITGSKILSRPVALNAFQTTIDISKLATGSYVLVYLNRNERTQTLFEKLYHNR